MSDYHPVLLNKSHIPNNPLRIDIVDEVNEYIRYAYADDVHADDYLTIDKNTLAVSHTRRSYGEPREANLVYYDISRLLAPVQSAFAYEPDQREIDAVVLDFFPIEDINKFPELVETAILEYSTNNDIKEETTIGFPVDTFEPSIYNPSELEVVEADPDEEELLLDCVEYVEAPIKQYIRVRNGKLIVNKHKLLLLALNNYYGN